MNPVLFGEDDNDQVVGEVDIFLAQPEKNCELYVLQYPLRNAHIGIGKDRRVTGVNVRPKHGRIEVKLAVLPEIQSLGGIGSGDPCASSFDMTQELQCEKAIGEEQCLRSRPNLTPPDSNYAVASFLSAGKSAHGVPSFTIVPVRSVTQMRPSFDYLDTLDIEVANQKTVEKEARATARGIHTRQQQQEHEDVAPLQVSFRRRETERAAERRKNSHATLRKREEGESWVPVRFIPGDDNEAIRRRKDLFTDTRPTATVVKEETLFDAATTYTDLFRSHTHHVQLGLVAKANTHSQQVSAKALKRLPTEAAVSQVVTQARIVSFGELHQLVGEDTRDNDVLSATRIVAMCLRGCWVAKKSNRKVLRGVKSAAQRFDAARVLILNVFRHKRAVSEAGVVEALGERMLISEVSMQAILNEVADRNPARPGRWEFRLNDDNDFAARHPDLCATQNGDWEQRVITARETLDRAKR